MEDFDLQRNASSRETTPAPATSQAKAKEALKGYEVQGDIGRGVDETVVVAESGYEDDADVHGAFVDNHGSAKGCVVYLDNPRAGGHNGKRRA